MSVSCCMFHNVAAVGVIKLCLLGRVFHSLIGIIDRKQSKWQTMLLMELCNKGWGSSLFVADTAQKKCHLKTFRLHWLRFDVPLSVIPIQHFLQWLEKRATSELKPKKRCCCLFCVVLLLCSDYSFLGLCLGLGVGQCKCTAEWFWQEHCDQSKCNKHVWHQSMTWWTRQAKSKWTDL